jgi:tetratricopeptide (TPR) repeat protein
MAGKLAEAIEGQEHQGKNLSTPRDPEARFNDLGYSLASRKRFRCDCGFASTSSYPQSSNVYDSLGEALLANGDKALAAINYKKALELDPHNQNAANILKKLQQ